MGKLIKVNFKALSSKKEEKSSLGKVLSFKTSEEIRRKKIYKLEKEIDVLEKIYGFNHPKVEKLWDEVEELWQQIFKGA